MTTRVRLNAGNVLTVTPGVGVVIVQSRDMNVRQALSGVTTFGPYMVAGDFQINGDASYTATEYQGAPAGAGFDATASARGIRNIGSNMIATAGDSRLDFGVTVDANNQMLNARGPQFWAGLLTGGRVRFPLEYNFAVAGTTTAALATTQLANVLASPCSVVCVVSGTNDRGNSLPLTDTITNLSTFISACGVAGKTVILLAEMPRTGSGLTAQQLAYFMNMRDWMKYTAPGLFPNLITVDAFDNMVDPSVTTLESRAGVMRSGDLLHPAPMGAYYAGLAFAGALNQLFPTRDQLTYTNADQYSADNPRGAINLNPAMLGTAGSTTTGTATSMTGTVADSFSLISLTAGGVSVVASKVARGQVATQRLVLSGTPSSTNGDISLEQSNATMLGRVSAGDVLELTLGVNSALSANLKYVGTRLSVIVDGVSYFAYGGQRDTGANFCAPEAFSGVIRTPRLTVPAGNLTEVRIRAYVGGYTGAALTADVAFDNMALRKIIA